MRIPSLKAQALARLTLCVGVLLPPQQRRLPPLTIKPVADAQALAAPGLMALQRYGDRAGTTPTWAGLASEKPDVDRQLRIELLRNLSEWPFSAEERFNRALAVVEKYRPDLARFLETRRRLIHAGLTPLGKIIGHPIDEIPSEWNFPGLPNFPDAVALTAAFDPHLVYFETMPLNAFISHWRDLLYDLAKIMKNGGTDWLPDARQMIRLVERHFPPSFLGNDGLRPALVSEVFYLLLGVKTVPAAPVVYSAVLLELTEGLFRLLYTSVGSGNSIGKAELLAELNKNDTQGLLPEDSKASLVDRVLEVTRWASAFPLVAPGVDSKLRLDAPVKLLPANEFPQPAKEKERNAFGRKLLASMTSLESVTAQHLNRFHLLLLRGPSDRDLRTLVSKARGSDFLAMGPVNDSEGVLYKFLIETEYLQNWVSDSTMGKTDAREKLKKALAKAKWAKSGGSEASRFKPKPYEMDEHLLTEVIEASMARLAAIGGASALHNGSLQTLIEKLGATLIDDEWLDEVSPSPLIVVDQEKWTAFERARDNFMKKIGRSGSPTLEDIRGEDPRLNYRAPELRRPRPDLVALHPSIQGPGLYLLKPSLTRIRGIDRVDEFVVEAVVSLESTVREPRNADFERWSGFPNPLACIAGMHVMARLGPKSQEQWHNRLVNLVHHLREHWGPPARRTTEGDAAAESLYGDWKFTYTLLGLTSLEYRRAHAFFTNVIEILEGVLHSPPSAHPALLAKA